MGKTSDHYTKQWGSELGFQKFVEGNPDSAMVMPGRQLGWGGFFSEIRSAGSERSISVYDAACGFGDVMRRLFEEPAPKYLKYVGADIHDSLSTIEVPEEANIIKWDISRPLPKNQKFDFIICRAALHHTPDPPATFQCLASQLNRGGKIAVSVYAKKAPMREVLDDYFRSQIVPMTNDEAFAISSQFSQLGRDLQSSVGKIVVTQDLPFLGLKAGEYSIQEFMYDHFLKCWYNQRFSESHCDLVNFDWYHPEYAFRFNADEVKNFALISGLELVSFSSIKAQHYLEARKPL